MKTHLNLSTLCFVLFLFVLFTSCSKDDVIDNPNSNQTPTMTLSEKKAILTSKTWYQANNCCPDDAYHLVFDEDSVYQTHFQTFDYITWYDSHWTSAYTLTDDTLDFDCLFLIFGWDNRPYRINEDSLILYPVPNDPIDKTYIYVSTPIPNKP